MAVHTEITLKEAGDALRGHQHEIGRVEALLPITAGLENTNYFLKTDQGIFVLTLHEPMIGTDHYKPPVEPAIDLMATLSEHFFPVPEPVGSMHEIKGKPATLTRLLPGTSISLQDATMAERSALGGILAHMHNDTVLSAEERHDFIREFRHRMAIAGEQILERPGRFDNAEGLAAYLEQRGCAQADAHHLAKAIFSDEMQQAFQEVGEVINHIETLWNKAEEAGITVCQNHCDLNAGNLLFGPHGELTGLIDFYLSRPSYAIHDLAHGLLVWNAKQESTGRQYDLDGMKDMVSAYAHVHPLSEEEIALLPDFLVAASLFRTIKRFSRIGEALAPEKENGPIEALKNPLTALEELQDLKGLVLDNDFTEALHPRPEIVLEAVTTSTRNEGQPTPDQDQAWQNLIKRQGNPVTIFHIAGGPNDTVQGGPNVYMHNMMPYLREMGTEVYFLTNETIAAHSDDPGVIAIDWDDMDEAGLKEIMRDICEANGTTPVVVNHCVIPIFGDRISPEFYDDIPGVAVVHQFSRQQPQYQKETLEHAHAAHHIMFLVGTEHDALIAKSEKWGYGSVDETRVTITHGQPPSMLPPWDDATISAMKKEAQDQAGDILHFGLARFGKGWKEVVGLAEHIADDQETPERRLHVITHVVPGKADALVVFQYLLGKTYGLGVGEYDPVPNLTNDQIPPLEGTDELGGIFVTFDEAEVREFFALMQTGGTDAAWEQNSRPVNLIKRMIDNRSDFQVKAEALANMTAGERVAALEQLKVLPVDISLDITKEQTEALIPQFSYAYVPFAGERGLDLSSSTAPTFLQNQCIVLAPFQKQDEELGDLRDIWVQARDAEHAFTQIKRLDREHNQRQQHMETGLEWMAANQTWPIHADAVRNAAIHAAEHTRAPETLFAR